MLQSDGTYAQDIQCIVPAIGSSGAIYISNLQAACNPLTLKRHCIEAVITCIKGKNLSAEMPQHIEYMYVPAVDHQSFNIATYFEDCLQLIESERRKTNVLVHCMAGVSRSVTIIAAYLIWKEGKPFEQVISDLKRKRKIISPNEGFVRQLKEFEIQVKNKENRKNYGIIIKQTENSSTLDEKQILGDSSKLTQSQIPLKSEYPIVFSQQKYDIQLKNSIHQLFNKTKTGSMQYSAKIGSSLRNKFKLDKIL